MYLKSASPRARIIAKISIAVFFIYLLVGLCSFLLTMIIVIINVIVAAAAASRATK